MDPSEKGLMVMDGRLVKKKALSVVVVTGLSGAGKSTALRVFEDLGFFCVDGLPATMAPKLADFFLEQDKDHRGLVLGLDLRQREFVEEWNQASKDFAKMGVRVQIVFLEARLDELVRRYATTRRPHPLESQALGLEQALSEERIILNSIRKSAELVIDTSGHSIHDLRRTIQEKWAMLEEKSGSIRIHLISFGFKYGVPIDADLVFDLRFLPNPYFSPELRAFSGKDKAVADFVFNNAVGQNFKKRFLDFLGYLLPLYAQEGRYRVTVALGCTGGRHRSVAMTEEVFRKLNDNYSVTLEHRHFELG